MATRVRTAAVWVPPLQEGGSSGNRIRKLQGQEPIVGQGTPDQKPVSGGPQQRHKSHRREQVLEWLFMSQEQLKTSESQGTSTPSLMSSSSWNKKSCGRRRASFQTKAIQTESGKLIITSNGIRKIKASWEVWQNTVSVLHLENCVFLLQILFLQDKSFINLAHMGRV
ncbi:PREDICTED: zinc finger protein 268 isoform X3 [Miniopterus natalensis]|uniref:zinc finger protein 268 isoform X3 n=1 Tax=Miniopterus natalensis TaxID=291302 RepID=UPI0007A6DFB4|nr:PREDICTED: zinc finger protein 268 isoform X3 [Miniopterus natalensis]